MEFRRHNCTYCGYIADTLDHVTPVSQLNTVGRSYNRKYVVPCCRECNYMLGNRGSTLYGYYTIASKAEYLEREYQIKYEPYIEGQKGDWSDRQIAEFGYSIRDSVKGDQRRRREIKNRIEHLQLVMERDPSIDEVWDSINTNRCALNDNEMEISYLGNCIIVKDYQNLSEKEIVDIAIRFGCNPGDVRNVLKGITVSDFSVRYPDFHLI